jgi:hypothetical protein
MRDAKRWTLKKLCLPAILTSAAAAIAILGAATHITPTVVLQKQADVIRASLPADRYSLKTVEVGKEDVKRIEDVGGFKLKEPKVKFYVGRDAGGQVLGVVLFPQVNTPHGPLEVGLTLAPDGELTKVAVTKATVETKPWIQKAIETGFLSEFEGAPAADGSSRALARLQGAHLGRLPEWMGKIAVQAVDQGNVLYRTLYGAQ